MTNAPAQQAGTLAHGNQTGTPANTTTPTAPRLDYMQAIQKDLHRNRNQLYKEQCNTDNVNAASTNGEVRPIIGQFAPTTMTRLNRPRPLPIQTTMHQGSSDNALDTNNGQNETRTTLSHPSTKDEPPTPIRAWQEFANNPNKDKLAAGSHVEEPVIIPPQLILRDPKDSRPTVPVTSARKVQPEWEIIDEEEVYRQRIIQTQEKYPPWTHTHIPQCIKKKVVLTYEECRMATGGVAAVGKFGRAQRQFNKPVWRRRAKGFHAVVGFNERDYNTYIRNKLIGKKLAIGTWHIERDFKPDAPGNVLELEDAGVRLGLAEFRTSCFPKLPSFIKPVTNGLLYTKEASASINFYYAEVANDVPIFEVLLRSSIGETLMSYIFADFNSFYALASTCQRAWYICTSNVARWDPANGEFCNAQVNPRKLSERAQKQARTGPFLMVSPKRREEPLGFMESFSHYQNFLMGISYHGPALHVLQLCNMDWVDWRGVTVILSACPRLEKIGVHNCGMLKYTDSMHFLDVVERHRVRFNSTLEAEFYPKTYNSDYVISGSDLNVSMARGVYRFLLAIVPRTVELGMDWVSPATPFRRFLETLPLPPMTLPMFLEAVLTKHYWENKGSPLEDCQKEALAADLAVCTFYYEGERPKWTDRDEWCANYWCNSCKEHIPGCFFQSDIRKDTPMMRHCDGCRLVTEVYDAYSHLNRERLIVLGLNFGMEGEFRNRVSSRWIGLGSHIAGVARAGKRSTKKKTSTAQPLAVQPPQAGPSSAQPSAEGSSANEVARRRLRKTKGLVGVCQAHENPIVLEIGTEQENIVMSNRINSMLVRFGGPTAIDMTEWVHFNGTNKEVTTACMGFLWHIDQYLNRERARNNCKDPARVEEWAEGIIARRRIGESPVRKGKPEPMVGWIKLRRAFSIRVVGDCIDDVW